MTAIDPASTHHRVPERPSDRKFGLFFVGIFVLIALEPLRHGAAIRIWAIVLAILLLGVTLLKPATLAPLNTLWLRFGMVLGRIFNPVIMAVIFFGVLTPIAWLMRRSGKAFLKMGFEPSAASYWIERVPPGPPPETMRNQF